MLRPMHKGALLKAVKIATSETELARRLTDIMQREIKQQHVWNWVNRDKSLPGEYCIPIEQAVQGAVTRHDLRPDLYPRETAA